MRVVVDATPLLVRSAGVKNYLYHWILHLRRAAGSATVGTFPAMERVRALNHEASMAGPLRTFSGLAALAISNHHKMDLFQYHDFQYDQEGAGLQRAWRRGLRLV